MAKTTTSRNPQLVHGPPLIRIDNAQAAASKTWEQGEFGVIDTSGQWAPIATDGQIVQGQFLTQVATSTTAGDLHPVGLITGVDQIFEGYLSSDDADAAAAQTDIGAAYGIHVGSNTHTVNKNETSNTAVIVTDIAPNYESTQNTTSTSPGKVKFRFIQSVLDTVSS